eukprot:gene12392-20516_t
MEKATKEEKAAKMKEILRGDQSAYRASQTWDTRQSFKPLG